MKILLVIPNDYLGGAEQYLKMVAEYYKDHRVDIFFLQRLHIGHWNNFPLSFNIKYFSKRSSLIGALQFFFHLLFQERKYYDHIYTSHVSVTGIIGIILRLGLLKKDKFIARESTSVFKRFSGLKLLFYKSFYTLGYSQVDLLICQTAFMKKQLLEGRPRFSKKVKIKVIPNPINLKHIKGHKNEETGAAPPEKFIVSAGRLIPEKGYDILIKAFAKIKKDHPNLHLLILGMGNERMALEELIKSLDLTESVLLPGRVKNVYVYFKKAQACIVSSRIEGFPNVLLQMMTQNNSVISTLCAGGIDKIPGIITVQTEDVDDLASAVERSLSATSKEKNRKKFDSFLRKRDITNFMKKVIKKLNDKKGKTY